MKKEVIVCMALGLLFSCNIPFDTREKLGSNFFLVESDNEYIEILYSEKRNSPVLGTVAIPSLVTLYNFDDDWIIATSLCKENDSLSYWIIDKNCQFSKAQIDEQLQKQMIGPLDSLQFYTELKKRSIKLKLKKTQNK